MSRDDDRLPLRQRPQHTREGLHANPVEVRVGFVEEVEFGITRQHTRAIATR